MWCNFGNYVETDVGFMCFSLCDLCIFIALFALILNIISTSLKSNGDNTKTDIDSTWYSLWDVQMLLQYFFFTKYPLNLCEFKDLHKYDGFQMAFLHDLFFENQFPGLQLIVMLYWYSTNPAHRLNIYWNE